MSYRGKRAFDLLLTIGTAPVWVPAVVVVAAVVRLTIGSPVFFRQERPGLAERNFRLTKFRTMSDGRGVDGRLLPDDQRLTAVGRVLRSTSLDELPELWNVVLGDMSLVGPRPLLPQYLSRYSVRHRRRHEVRPGLTGLAQVAGRNTVAWDERLDLDVSYVDTASLLLDMKILAATVRSVITRRGISAPGHATMPEFRGSSPSDRASAPLDTAERRDSGPLH